MDQISVNTVSEVKSKCGVENNEFIVPQDGVNTSASSRVVAIQTSRPGDAPERVIVEPDTPSATTVVGEAARVPGRSAPVVKRHLLEVSLIA